MTSPHRGREGGGQILVIWGDFQGMTGVTREGGGLKTQNLWMIPNSN